MKKNFPFKAFLWGILFVVFISYVDPVFLNGLTADFVGGFAILCLFFIIIFLNPVLNLIKKNFSLSQSEILLIFTMCLTACVIPSWGLMANLIPIISGFKYYASPENRWEEFVIPNIRKFLIPQDINKIRMFFEGVPKNYKFPYSKWFLPLSFWFLFYIILSFFFICIAVILRKQWVEKEKLIFPIALLPVEITKYRENEKIPSLLKNQFFWIGFSIPFLYSMIVILRSFFPSIPNIILWKSIPVFRRTTNILFVLSWPIFGFSYFVNLNVLFSLWFLHLLSKIQTGYLNITGYSLPGHTECFDGSSAVTTYQGAGAVIIFFIFLIWQARRHLKDIFRKAVYNLKEIDDSEEILSYRICFFGFLISFILLIFFFFLMGMPFFVSIVFLFYTLATFVALNRLICQAGLGFARSQCPPESFTAYILPPDLVGSSGYAGIGIQYPWAGDIRTTILTSTQNSLKIKENTDICPRYIFLSILLSIIISYFVSAYSHLTNGFKIGALNKHPWFFQFFPQVTGNFILDKIKNPLTKEIIYSRYLFTGIGAGIMAFLIFMTTKFLWWPIHYIGYPFCDSLPIERGWFSIFLAYIIKLLVLKYGGIHIYRKFQPFFYGIIVGAVAGCGAGMIIAVATHNIGQVGVFFGI